MRHVVFVLMRRPPRCLCTVLPMTNRMDTGLLDLNDLLDRDLAETAEERLELAGRMQASSATFAEEQRLRDLLAQEDAMLARWAAERALED